MGLLDKPEKKICKKCDKVLKPISFIQSMRGEKSGNVEYSDGWYCAECAKQRKKK